MSACRCVLSIFTAQVRAATPAASLSRQVALSKCVVIAVAGTNIRFTGAFALWLFSRHAHLVEPGDWNARLIEDVVQVRNVVLAAAFIALGKDYSLRRA